MKTRPNNPRIRIVVGTRVISLKHRVAGVYNGLVKDGRFASVKTDSGYIYPLRSEIVREGSLIGQKIIPKKLTRHY